MNPFFHISYSVESPLIVREQLGSLVIRAFHLSVESPIVIVLFIIIIIIFLPSKCFFVWRLIDKHYTSSYSTSQESIKYHPTSLTFDPLRSYWPFHKNPCYEYSSLTVNEMAMKPLLDFRGQLGGLVGTLNKRIQWPLKELLPLEFYNF